MALILFKTIVKNVFCDSFWDRRISYFVNKNLLK
jgi:hypothetical protein